MIEVNNIEFSYGKNTTKILDDVSFSIDRNECIAILGNNGAGKSTLIKCIDHICHPKEGVVLVDGNNAYDMTANEMAKNIAYVPQKNNVMHMTVFDAVLLGRKPYIEWNSTLKDKEIVSNIIHKMELEDLALRDFSELSGGEAQKVMLARALAQEPKLLLLDEPTSNLDPKNQHEVLRNVKMIAKEHDTCVAIIIHDLNLAVRYCDRFLFLKDNKLFAYGGLEIMTPKNIGEVYNIHVHIMEYMGVPVVVPFPDEKV